MVSLRLPGESSQVRVAGLKPSLKLACSPGGRSVIGDNTVGARLWHVGEGREHHVLEGHSGLISSEASSPADRKLALERGGEDGTGS